MQHGTAGPRGDLAYWQQVELVFAAVADADPAARRALLDMHCVDRPDVRAEVESLLAAHAPLDPDIPPFSLPALLAHFESRGMASAGAEPADLAGRQVGPFRLVQRIARGGMGDVYRGERVDGAFTQQVAVKLLSARVVGSDAAQRFRAERQILASLQHPHIVRLLDGGVTADGQPYIVMEFVDGAPIDACCRDQARSLDARLQLFLQLTAAVAWAHRHLVVHRDLKPANILVTAEGVVKVLDFGVAKLLRAGPEEASGTVAGFAPMTLSYASPEQLLGLPASTSCDVYALGVVLFELLTGRLPYDTSGLGLADTRALVVGRERVRPSSVHGIGLPYDTGTLRGDLDAIVLKALRDDPQERYASVEDLADDIRRFNAGHPITARTPSFGYVTRKLIRRHRAAVSVAGVAAVLLLAALVGALWQARTAALERERAVRRFNDVRELAGSLIFRIHDEVAPLAGSTPVRKTIVAEGLEFLRRLEADAGGDSRLLTELSEAYVRIGHVQGRLGEANLGERDSAIASYRKAQLLVAPLIASGAFTWEVANAAVGAHLALSAVLSGDDARAEAAAALTLAERWHAGEPEASRSQTLLARAHFQRAVGLGYPLSLPHWQQAERLFHAVHAADAGDPTKMRNLALAQKYLGAYHEEAGALDQALALFQSALALDEQRLSLRPGDRQAQLDYAIDIGNVANVHLRRGAHDAAIAAFLRSLQARERIAAADPKDVFAQGRVAFVHTKLATLYTRTARLAVAREHVIRAIEIVEPLLPVASSYRTQQFGALKTHADIESADGRHDAACRLYRRARQLVQADGLASPVLSEQVRDVDRQLGKCVGE